MVLHLENFNNRDVMAKLDHCVLIQCSTKEISGHEALINCYLCVF